MGRPVNKKYFGEGAGNQIKVRAKIGTNTEGDGFIISQRSTNRFKVSVNGTEGICTLVNKDSDTLGENEMIVNVFTDAGTWVQATKLYNRTVITEGNIKVKWTFATSDSDNAVEVPDVEEFAYTLTIAIDTQPASTTVTAGDPVQFTVAASGVSDLEYQWEVDDGTGFAELVGETADTLDILDSTGLDGYVYRVVVSSASDSAEPVTSSSATLTVE